MFENLLDLVKQHAGSAIIDNPAIPNEHNDEAVSMASNSIVDGLKSAIAGGNMSDLVSMFSNSSNAGNSSVSQGIQGNLVESLMGKFGIDSSAAGGIASSLIPTVMQQFVSKTNDPNDSSFDLQSIVGNLTGGKASGIDLQGLLSQFTGGGGSSSSGGGLMDTVKGFFN
jgi:hypothetical protein